VGEPARCRALRAGQVGGADQQQNTSSGLLKSVLSWSSECAPLALVAVWPLALILPDDTSPAKPFWLRLVRQNTQQTAAHVQGEDQAC